jgi:hypothetical protein
VWVQRVVLSGDTALDIHIEVHIRIDNVHVIVVAVVLFHA